MRLRILILMLTMAFFGCQKNQDTHSEHNHAQDESKNSKSPRTAAMANIGDNHVHIDYSSPSVRSRQIWGGLVSYNEVWVMGAHKATSINFSQDVMIGNKKVEKGKYALFAIPDENKWTLIINEDWDQHLADNYDPSKDLVRIEVIPTKTDQLTESLNFEVAETEPGNGRIIMNWENLEVSFNVENIK